MKKVLIVAILLVGVAFLLNAEAKEDAAKVHTPKKVQVDTDHDGKIDRIETYDTYGAIAKVEADTTGDGVTDEWVYYEAGEPSKSERDTNGDGKPDIWMEY